MQNTIENYIYSISSKFSHTETTEMGYRTDFEILLKDIFEAIKVTRFDHDAKSKQGNKPDFVVLNHDIPILYIETKDIGISLDKIEVSEQMSRYFGYANLVLTDYVEFRFYRNGIRYEDPIKIANYNLKTRTITAIPENYEHVAKTLIDFTQSHKEPIKSGAHLAKIMGGKAQRIRDNVLQFLVIKSEKNTELIRVYETIKKLLVHDLAENAFADMYAQTLVYGLFVARYYDDTPRNFTRQEARDLIPKSNPLLRHFFDHIVGPNFDKRLEYIVNELCEVFSHADVTELMKEYFNMDLFGETHKERDPVIHFYEDFLKEYDPELRKKMGAYYTPPAVVQFIIGSVDFLLKKDFGLFSGLADTSKLKNNTHRVQILDPAVGTGTFISSIIDMIYKSLQKNGQIGRWPAYVHNDLLPRLHGFELMMAPYTIAHLKIGMSFSQTGFKYFNRRLGIYLTNSLEKSNGQGELFTAAFGLAESIAEESKEASVIKNETPIMVVIGNPPYSGESSNASYNGNDVYKKEPTGEKLKERNSKWLNDDYVKFIRLAESMIEKTGEGIVAMITAHGYIDNPTFRGMRFHLMKTFDEIYVFDLHGNANKKERSPDGSDDKNVFDIKTGVSIFFGIKKNGNKSKEVKIYHADCFGTRSIKFEYLNSHLLDSVNWEIIEPIKPNYEWVAHNEKIREQYKKGFSVSELFSESSVGIVTARDNLAIQFNRKNIEKIIEDFQQMDSETLRVKYHLGKDAQDWKVSLAKKDVIENFDEEKIIPISYRPFDIRWTFYTGNSRGFHCRPRGEIMKNFVDKENIGFITVNRSPQNTPVSYYFITDAPHSNGYIRSDSVSIDTIFPLYLYTSNGIKTPNFNEKIINEIEEIVGKIPPEDIFDYVYAALYSPSYREKYKEFLKIDFPRIPYPKDEESFKKMVELGTELRLLHLFKSPKLSQFITTYPIEGSNIVKNLNYREGNVYINGTQYFGNIPALAWDFFIGGYQPAQKWLKDRKGRTLTNSDLEHYQEIIIALSETDRIMKDIEKVLVI